MVVYFAVSGAVERCRLSEGESDDVSTKLQHCDLPYSLHYHHRRCGCGCPSPTSLGDAGSIKIKGGWVFAIRKLHHSNNSVIKRVQSVRHHSTSGAGCTLVSAQLTGFSCYWKDFASEWKRMTFLFDRQTDRQLGHLVPPPRAFANNPRGFCAAARGSASSPRRLAFTTHRIQQTFMGE